MFPDFPFGLHHRADFLLVLFAYHSLMRGKVAALRVRAVNTVIDSDKPHAFFYKQDFGVKAHFQIIATKPRHILDNQGCNFAVFDFFQKLAPTRTVEVRPGIPVIYEKQGSLKNDFPLRIYLKSPFDLQCCYCRPSIHRRGISGNRGR